MKDFRRLCFLCLKDLILSFKQEPVQDTGIN